MVLAVLEAHCGVQLGGHDVYLNVAGGLRISEPAADLAVAAALVSSLAGAPLPPDAVYFGEIGLSGAVRPVAQAAGAAEGGGEARLRPRRRCRAPARDERSTARSTLRAIGDAGRPASPTIAAAGRRPRRPAHRRQDE